MPALDDDILRELLKTFRAEGAEYVQVMNQSLLQFERAEHDDERATALQEAFRAAHSMKGAARAVNLLDIEAIAHAVETLFQQAQQDPLLIDASTADVLYDSFDLLESLIRGDEKPIDALQTRLRELLGTAADGVDAEPTDEPQMVPEPTQVTANGSADETIRVSIDKLDDLMAQVGELLVAKISAEQRLSEVRGLRLQLERWPQIWRELKMLLPDLEGALGKQLREVLFSYAEHMQVVNRSFDTLDQAISRDTRRLEMVANTLQDRVRRVRMVPFQNIALLLERTVRDAARATEKVADFSVIGSHVELDKKVLETLKDPLLHLLRNAVYHGLETPQEREAAGKPPTGCVEVVVQQRGNEVRITVTDDGRGFNLDALRAKAGKISNDDQSLTVDEAVALAFRPGVSTAETINELAGRGIGLDVVRDEIEGIRGRINVDTHKGEGTAFTITAPTSLAITRALLIAVQAERYVIPLLSIEKILAAHDVTLFNGKALINVDGDRLALHSLASVLEMPAAETPISQQLVLVLNIGAQRIAMLVDDVITEVELSVTPLGHPLKNVRNVLGAALLGNGEPIVMLNPIDLIKAASKTRFSINEAARVADDDDAPALRVLVVDDSITTRTLEKNILQMAGYNVTTATNGYEALTELGKDTYDILISDVQMPHMGGIELAQTVRNNDNFMNLPIILVTSLESKEDRERGLNAGANAYIVKRGFDQEELLTTIQQLVG